jgi:cysteine sulfinate desulfinase/cysteine desulfurase-like protein
MERTIYMDYNATTPVLPEVLDEMLPFLREGFGNPSSTHWAGRKAREAVELARQRVAELLNCEPGEIVFTSCATESNNAAIKGVAAALAKKGNHIITTKVEHPSVLYPALHLEKSGYRVTCLEVDADGMVDVGAIEEAITEQTVLISAMLANNETGTIFPVAEIGRIAAKHGVTLHCDAVQAVGKIAVDWRELQTGLLSLSGHKLYAPKGVGALVVRKGVKMTPYLHGGGRKRTGAPAPRMWRGSLRLARRRRSRGNSGLRKLRGLPRCGIGWRTGFSRRFRRCGATGIRCAVWAIPAASPSRGWTGGRYSPGWMPSASLLPRDRPAVRGL